MDSEIPIKGLHSLKNYQRNDAEQGVFTAEWVVNWKK